MKLFIGLIRLCGGTLPRDQTVRRQATEKKVIGSDATAALYKSFE